jgi:hypothetical protein
VTVTYFAPAHFILPLGLCGATFASIDCKGNPDALPSKSQQQIWLGAEVDGG